MPVFDDNDPIVRLALEIQELLTDKDDATVIAALASALGAMLDYAAENVSDVPPEFLALRENLMALVTSVVSARAFATQRES